MHIMCSIIYAYNYYAKRQWHCIIQSEACFQLPDLRVIQSLHAALWDYYHLFIFMPLFARWKASCHFDAHKMCFDIFATHPNGIVNCYRPVM